MFQHLQYDILKQAFCVKIIINIGDSLFFYSARGKLPIWPFTSLSVFFGAFALLPYFGLWEPPPPKVSKEEIEGWPLKILDSKILAGVCILFF